MNPVRRLLAGLGAALLLGLAAIVGGGPAAAGLTGAGLAGTTRAEPAESEAGALGVAPQATPARDRAVITLTDVTPVVVAPGTTVTIKGIVTAPTVGALLGASLDVVRGPGTLDRRGQVAAWAAETKPARGRVVGSTTLPTVNAGQSTTFSIDIPSSRVGTVATFAAIPLSIEVTPRAATQPAGVLRTFLSWQSRKEYVPIQIATVLPVTLDPDPDLFSNHDDKRVTAWRSAIGPGSRVQRLIDGSAEHDVTLAVDPSVFGPSLAGSDGGASSQGGSTPQGGGSTGTPTPGGTSPTSPAPPGTADPTTPAPSTPAASASTTTPAPPTTGPTGAPAVAGAAVEALGNEVVTELRGRTVWALPYADADLAAALGVDPTNGVVRDLVNRSSIVGQRLGHSTRSDVMLPVDGLFPAGRERALTTLLRGTQIGKPAGIVVNNAAITGTTAYTPSARRLSATGTRLLGWDPALSRLLPSRGGSGSAAGVAPRQEFLAETLALLAERPGTERSVLVLGPRTYDPDPAALRDLLSAIDAAPWLTPVDAQSLLVDSGEDVATRAETPPKPVASAAPGPVLDRARLSRMADERETLRRVSTVLRDGAAFEATYREVLDELASTRWRWNPKAWTGLEASVATNVREATSAIQVVPRSFNFLAEQGTLTLTVENGLDFAVEDIRLVLAPTNPRMQVVKQPPPIRIGAESKTSVKVTVRAVAAGQADIRAFLTTADGTPIGRPATIPVAANPLDSTIYWVGGTIAALVLVAGVARSLLKGTSRIDEIPDTSALDIDANGSEHDPGGRST